MTEGRCYRDGRVHIGGKVYQAGYFATHLLNQFYENDTAEQFKKDMTREALYALTDKRLKQRQ